MQQYIILSKQQFISLLAFGHLPLGDITTVSIDSKEEIQEAVRKALLILPPFQGDEEYLVVTYNVEFSTTAEVSFENIEEIIPFSEQAYRGYQSKFDSNIRFSKPRFENVFAEVADQIEVNDRWSACKKIPSLLFPNYSNSDRELNRTDIELAYQKRTQGDTLASSASFESFVLAYDRYEPFPNKDVGYIYDVGQAFGKSIGKSGFVGSGLYNFLEKNKPLFVKSKLSKLLNVIENEVEVTKFRNHLTSHSGLKKYIAATLFFKFKDLIKREDRMVGTPVVDTVTYLQEKQLYIPELKLALSLIGAFFGFRRLRSDIYQLSDISWYASTYQPKSMAIPEKNQSVELEFGKTEPTVSRGDTVEFEITPTTDNTSSEPLFPVASQNTQSIDESVFQDVDEKFGPGTHEFKNDLYKEVKNTLNKCFRKENLSRRQQVCNFLRTHYPNRLKSNDRFLIGPLVNKT